MNAMNEPLRARVLAGEAGAIDEWSRALADSGPIGARYASGDTVGAWTALTALGTAAFAPQHAVEASAVAFETMRRVRHNLGVLLGRLDHLGYQHASPRALGTPVSEADLVEIERHLGGPLPWSLRAFWGVVGSVDLTQAGSQLVHDWIEKPASDLQSLGDDDPLVFPSPSPLSFALFDPEETDEQGRRLVLFSGDRFSKGGVSGGPGYAMRVPERAADFRIVGDVCPAAEAPSSPSSTEGQFFVRMLRDCMKGGGFRGPIDRSELDSDSLHTTLLPLRPLQRQLAEGLLPI